MDPRTELELRRRLAAAKTPREELAARRALASAERESRGFGEELGRQAGLTARAGINASLAFPAMLADAATGLYNTGADFAQGKGQGFRFKAQLPVINKGLTRLGMPTPENAQERVVQAGATGMAAGPMSVVGTTSGVLPAIAGALSGGTSQYALEKGAEPWEALGLGLAAGLTPAAGAAAAHKLAPIAHVPYKIVRPYTQAGRDQAKGELLDAVVGDKRQAVLSALNENKRFVRGTQNTAATAAEPAQAVELAGLERALHKFNSTGAAERELANEAARMQAVRSVGKTPQALKQAEAQRSAGAAADYGRAFQQPTAVTPELAQLAADPYIKEAMQAALKVAKSRGVDPKTDLTRFLHLTKKAMDDMVRPASQGGGLGPEQQIAVLDAQRRLLQWMEGNNPLYQVARENYKQASKPVNQMQVGQYLEQKLASPLADSPRPAVFAQAMRDAPGTIRRASGRSMEKMEDVLARPQQMIIEGVLEDLARQRRVTTQAAAGEKGAIAKMGQAFETVQPPGMLERAVMIARAVLERMQRGTSQRTLTELAVDMQSPEKIASLLARMTPKEQATFLQELQRAAQGSAQAGAAFNAQE